MKKLFKWGVYIGIIYLIYIIPYSITIILLFILLIMVPMFLNKLLLVKKANEFFTSDIYKDPISYESRVHKYSYKVFKNQPLLRECLIDLLMNNFQGETYSNLRECCSILNIDYSNLNNLTKEDLKKIRKHINSFHPDISQSNTSEKFMKMNDCFKRIKHSMNKDPHENT
ncbi:MAG: hypothetical protein WC136_01915 [Sphaerochaeta sp.]